MSFIFLSHSSQDDAAAGALHDWLREEGHAAVFLDHDAEAGIVGGETWEERLYTELRRCRALIALVSPDWLASPWCAAEADHAQALRKPVLPIRIKPIDPTEYAAKAPPVLRRVQSIDWDQSEEARERLRRGLLTAGLDPKHSFILRVDRAPYPGLAAFQREDAAVYFGREQEITDLLALLRECRAPSRPRLVLVQGASGTGKSSLLRAGVLPRLERDPENWLVVPPFRPLRDPFQSLTDALAAATGAPLGEPPPASSPPNPANQAAWAKWIINTAAELRRRAGRPEATVLLSVDQLEEALAGSIGGMGDAFLLALREALTAADHRLLVVATLRADFTGTLQRHAALREPAAAGSEILATRALQLGPLPRAAFHAVIEDPADLVGLELEPGLTSRIVDEARTDDALPLLAFALRELWDRYGKKDLKLTSAEYDSFGGLEAAVGSRAEQILAVVKSSAEELEAFRTTLVFGMTELSAEGRILRRPLPWAKVPEAARRLVEEFARARLLVVDEATVEVVHEALFRRWEPLKGWIEDAKEDLGIQRRAREAAEEWDRAGRPQGSLWRPPDLDLLRRYAERNASTLDAVQAAFLDASKRQERLARWSRRAAVGLIVLLAIGAGVFGWESQKQARRALDELAQRLEADTARLAQAARKQADEGHPEVGIQLTVAALASHAEATAPPPSRWRAVDALAWSMSAGSMSTGPLPLSALPHKHVISAKFSPDGRRVLAASLGSGARLWDANTGRELFSLGHTSATPTAHFSPDGQKVLTDSRDGGTRLWDAATGAELAALPQLEGEYFRAFSPDGRRLLTGIENGPARVRDASDGRELLVLQGEHPVYSAVFSPDGQKVATGSEDGTARLWDAATGRELLVLRGHEKKVAEVAFSPDGQKVATGSEDGTARLWDAATGRELLVLRGHTEPIFNITFSPDGQKVLTLFSDRDGAARLWDAATGRELLVLQHPRQTLAPELAGLPAAQHKVWSAAFSPDGRKIVTTSPDNTARLWDVATGAEIAILRHPHSITSAMFSPDGQKVLTTSQMMIEDGLVTVWDVGSGRELLKLQHEQDVQRTVFSPDGQTMLTLAGGTARLWDAHTGREFLVLPHPQPISFATFSRDGKKIVTTSADKTTRLWDASGRELLVLQHETEAQLATLSRDGQKIVTALKDGTARLWDANSGRELLVLRHPPPVFPDELERASPPGLRVLFEQFGLLGPDTLISAVFSPDGQKVLTVSKDRIGGDFTHAKPSFEHAVRLWDAVTGRELVVLRHEGGIFGAEFSPDGQKVATGSQDGSARLWDAATGAELAVLRGHMGPVGYPTFSRDGQKIATGSEDSTVRLWDVATGAELAILRGHERPITSSDFDADGQRVLTASEDGTARLWDAATGAELAVLRHEKEVGVVRFSPDGQRALTNSGSTARLWQLPTHRSVEDLVTYAKGLALPGLNEAQCREFGVAPKLCTWPPP
ncbi:TIR domain-containing protein [Microvirga massiliensis]|uniref:nSTAND1 domain-containing NTPase n=1 Tax=Microvirga massiliensis TaxID=1033741 RepID=UPI00164ED283|nr:TIR domain-containing protein [Microvirga massiliensis]